MDLTDIRAQLELACRYFRKNPTNQVHYEGLKATIHSAFEWADQNGVDRGFLYLNPIFQQAWDLCFPPAPAPPSPAAQHRSNVVYLTGRLQPF